jgi:hypothetical protein
MTRVTLYWQLFYEAFYTDDSGLIRYKSELDYDMEGDIF